MDEYPNEQRGVFREMRIGPCHTSRLSALFQLLLAP